MGKELPLVSIVVPSFNQGRYLAQALDSIFQQGYPRLEVVVMDGGSSDETLEVLQTYIPRLKHWRSTPDEGQSAAISEGIGHCSGDLVGWLNSDDFYWKDALWTVGRAWLRFPDRGLYIGNGFRYDEKAGGLQAFCPRHVALNRRALIEGLDYVLQPATFFGRRAWEEAGGLKPQLRFCMDWDLIIRVAAREPAVLIDEMLAASREHAEAKTSWGRLPRALEIARMIEGHSGREATPGTLFYLLETVLGLAERAGMRDLYDRTYEGIHALRLRLAEDGGNRDGFPERSDPQDQVYLPTALEVDGPAPAIKDAERLPSLSLVTPSFNQARFLEQALESVAHQRYPRLEHVVLDGGSRDGSVEVLKRHEAQLAFWVSEKDRGPAAAINRGLGRATGEVLGWLNSDDMLAEGALLEIGRAFAEDPELDMVFGNALYIDDESQRYLADHGAHRTAVYRGEMQPWERVPAYWTYVHALPQPTVFFRRRLLERHGPLDESYHFIFDFELFWRFAKTARVKKIEKTLAFYRIHPGSKTSGWDRFLVELYRFSRPWWPPPSTRAFRQLLASYIDSFALRSASLRRRDLAFWPLAAAVALSAVMRVGNPESWPGRPLWRRLFPRTLPA